MGNQRKINHYFLLQMSDGPLKKRRVVVKSVRVKKSDLSAFSGAVRGGPLPPSLFSAVDSEVVLSGPLAGERVDEPVTVTKVRILREPELPQSIMSHKRPAKKSTALLWSRRRFLKRLYELKAKRR